MYKKEEVKLAASQPPPLLLCPIDTLLLRAPFSSHGSHGPYDTADKYSAT